MKTQRGILTSNRILVSTGLGLFRCMKLPLHSVCAHAPIHKPERIDGLRVLTNIDSANVAVRAAEALQGEQTIYRAGHVRIPRHTHGVAELDGACERATAKRVKPCWGSGFVGKCLGVGVEEGGVGNASPATIACAIAQAPSVRPEARGHRWCRGVVVLQHGVVPCAEDRAIVWLAVQGRVDSPSGEGAEHSEGPEWAVGLTRSRHNTGCGSIVAAQTMDDVEARADESMFDTRAAAKAFGRSSSKRSVKPASSVDLFDVPACIGARILEACV